MAIDLKRVKEIFLEAAELPDAAARTAYLESACGGDAAVRHRVEALLRSHDPEGSFLGTPAAVVPDPDGPDSDETMALEVRRIYKLALGTTALIAINTHPASRFRHSMTMRRVKG